MIELRKKVYRFCIILIVFLSINSCVERVNVSNPEFESIPVINAILKKDSTITLNLTEAVSMDSSMIPTIDNASIELWEDDISLGFLTHIDSGIYSSPVKIINNSRYSIKIEIPGNITLYSSDSIPSGVIVQILSYSNTAWINSEGIYAPAIEFKFDDNESTTDYYELIISERESEYTSPYRSFNEDYSFLINEGIEPFSTLSWVFKDDFLNDANDRMKILLEPQGYGIHCLDSICYQVFEEKTVFLELRKISEHYYQFVKHYYLYEQALHPVFVEGIIVPLSLYSNVENGLGIFAGYTSAIDSMFIEEGIVPVGRNNY
jgi:hypothetical protein